MPISAWGVHDAQHWLEVKDIICRSIEGANFTPKPVWQSAETDIIQSRIVKNLYECDMVVCDISALNPNVMFELGMRLTFKKPVVIVADKDTRLPFDTGVIDTLIYPTDLHFSSIERFMHDLTARITDLHSQVKASTFKPYLDTFGAFTVVDPQSQHVPYEEFVTAQLENIAQTLKALDYRVRLNEENASAERVKGALDSFKGSVDTAKMNALLKSASPEDIARLNREIAESIKDFNGLSVRTDGTVGPRRSAGGLGRTTKS
ncbi:hypothetical protein NJ75_03859 [Novosphingobium subterraneum]|uniref:Uncharacterized protein n=2 Tax=Novosphingobium subterraneum TaxID=48936 RepID=A0A0B8ZAG9_9SPHN|nr:hypothetical protein NJ75_03859 [Novosphingobium subterraneum]